MAFIQAIGFETDKRDEILALMGLWSADAIGNGTAQRGTMLEDRANPGRFVMSVWFESAEAAEENSGRPETSAFAEQFASLCTTAPEFQEFDVVDRYHP